MLSKFIARLRACRKGATSIEYALIASGVALAIAIIVFTMGGTVAGLFGTVNAGFGG